MATEWQRLFAVLLPFCVLLTVIATGCSSFGMATGLLDRNFTNLAQAFHDNGLPWCFMNSLLNTGIDRPEDYSPEEIRQLLDEIEEDMQDITGQPKPTGMPVETPVPEVTPEITKEPDATETPDITETPEITEMPEPTNALEGENGEETAVAGPNIIFLQLESFFDPNYIENITFSSNPVPFFTYLKEGFKG